jgi:hypothetical protein
MIPLLKIQTNNIEIHSLIPSLVSAAVAGNERMEGLRASGHRIPRADHILKRNAGTGHIVVTGKRRRRRYRLTTDGLERASNIARRLASLSPQARSE